MGATSAGVEGALVSRKSYIYIKPHSLPVNSQLRLGHAQRLAWGLTAAARLRQRPGDLRDARAEGRRLLERLGEGAR